VFWTPWRGSITYWKQLSTFLQSCCLVESHLPTLPASVKWFVCCIQPLSLSLSLSPLSKPATFIEKKTQTIETTKTTTSIIYQASKPLGTHSINCLFPDSVARSTSSSLYSFLAHSQIEKWQFACFITCLHCALYLQYTRKCLILMDAMISHGRCSKTGLQHKELSIHLAMAMNIHQHQAEFQSQDCMDCFTTIVHHRCEQHYNPSNLYKISVNQPHQESLTVLPKERKKPIRYREGDSY
jgi:hypothetical protein